MADIFREVNEDLRRDRATQLWKTYGAYVIGAAVAIVLGTLAHQLWQSWDLDRRTELSEQYVAATELAADDRESAILALAEIGGPDGGYGTLATFERAQILADDGRHDEALVIWEQLAADSSGGPAFQAVAMLFSVMHQIDDGDPAALEAKLQPLTTADNRFRPLAMELGAILALRQGQIDQARQIYTQIADDLAAPAGLRTRAAQMVAALKEGPS